MSANNLSPELMAKMVADLDAMRTKDPESFLNIMQAAGLPGAPPAGGAPPVARGDGSQPKVTDEQLMAFAQMLQAMQQGGEGAGLEMPGGRGSLGPEGMEAKPPGKYVTPSPGFVVKTRTEDESGTKVFINLCTHEDLGEPGMKKRLDANGEEVEGLNIPMSVGPRKDDTDKAGSPCITFDIMVNPTVVKDAMEDQVGKNKDFLCQLAIQSLEQKYKLSLDRRYKLPKLKVHGELQQQYIQDRKSMPKIEEVSSKKAASKAAAKPAAAPKIVKEDVRLNYAIGWETAAAIGEVSVALPWTHPRGEYVEPVESPADEVTSILISAEVEGVSGTDVSVKLSPFRCTIKVKGYTAVSIYFPCAIVPPTSSVRLHRPEGAIKRAELRVTLPVDRSPWEEAADAGSKTWLVAQAMDGSSDGGNTALYKTMVKDSLSKENDQSVDNFHVKNRNYDANGSRLAAGDSDDEELPEDLFHKKDAMSSYLLQQRREEARDREKRSEEAKKERMDDPNVEYVDVEDYRPGGKYGDPLPAPKAAVEEAAPTHSAHLQQAASVLSAVVTEMKPGMSAETEAPGAQEDAATSLASLSSKMWSELL